MIENETISSTARPVALRVYKSTEQNGFSPLISSVWVRQRKWNDLIWFHCFFQATEDQIKIKWLNWKEQNTGKSKYQGNFIYSWVDLVKLKF
jgi:hypothetical protein